MIAKRITRKQGQGSDFAKLTRYVLDARGRVDPATWSRTADYILDTANHGNKVAGVRVTNCLSDDPAMAAVEIQRKQERNTRAKGDKTYHLVVSFPPGERPTEAQLHHIEDQVCEAIGLKDHQRISAVHIDTDHLHMHIAISKVHPLTLRNIEPYYDKRWLMRTCERLEVELGLQRTNHGLQSSRDNSRSNEHERDRQQRAERNRLDPRAAAALRKSYLDEIATKPAANSLNGVRSLSGVGVVQFAGGPQVLLPGDAPLHLDQGRPQRTERMRRGSDGEGAARSGGDGWEVGRGLGAAAERMEAYASRESLQGWARERLRGVIASTGGWAELHRGLAEYDLVVKPRGAGLVIGARNGVYVRASLVDRRLSLESLVRRWGSYKAPGDELRSVKVRESYQGTPKQKAPNTGELFAEFQRERDKALAGRGEARDRLRQAHQRYRADLAGWYEDERHRIKSDKRLRGRDKLRALQGLAAKKRIEFDAARKLEKTQREELTKALPLPTWQMYLEGLAAAGDGRALAVLRTRSTAKRQFEENLVRAPDAASARHVVFHNLKPKARRNGDLVYQVADGGIVIDTAAALRVELSTVGSAVVALTLAQERYKGQRLVVDGSAEFRASLARTAGEKGLAVQFADAAMEETRQMAAGARGAKAPEQPQAAKSGVESYITERNELRERLSDIHYHRKWSPEDSGPAVYKGRRRFADGSEAVLLERNQAVLVMQVTKAQAAKAAGWKVGQVVNTDQRGRFVFTPSPTKGAKR